MRRTEGVPRVSLSPLEQLGGLWSPRTLESGPDPSFGLSWEPKKEISWGPLPSLV